MSLLNQVIEVDAAARDDEKGLTTLEAVLDELPNADGDDVATCRRITRKIRAATDRLLNFTNWGEFVFQRYDVRVSGTADDTLVLPRTPVSNLILVEFLSTSAALSSGDGIDITDETELLFPDAGIVRYRFGYQWTPMIDWSLRKALTEFGNPVPGTEDPNYRVVFEAGYRLPGQKVDSPAPQDSAKPAILLPGDLEQACIDIVVSEEESRSSSNAGGTIRSERVDQTRVQYFSPEDASLAAQFGLTPKAFYIADAYRRAA